MFNIERSQFVDISEDDLEEFICGIYLSVFIERWSPTVAVKHFANNVLRDGLRPNNTCPNDRQVLTRANIQKPALIVINLLNNLKIKCDFASNGCKSVIKLENRVKHRDECDYNPDKYCVKCDFNLGDYSKHNCIDNLSNKISWLNEKNTDLSTKCSDLSKNIETSKSIIIRKNDMISDLTKQLKINAKKLKR